MPVYTYLFEAKSIQSYLLTTNRLKEIVGGSEMVEALTGVGGLLDDARKAVGGEITFSRRGGGAFFAFSEDESTRNRLADLWPLLVRQHAPDLEFVQARGHGDSAKAAYDDAHPRLLADRNRPQARYPQAAPLTIRNRRSGEPATTYARSKKGAKAEPVDAATARKLNGRFCKGAALGRRFAPDAPWESWPLNLAPADGDDDERNFPFLGEDRALALVHADGNGLGQLLIKLNQAMGANHGNYVEIFRAFSEAVSTATESAAQAATRKVLAGNQLEGVYPARPIVLGGDDLTMLVRADLALPFTRTFLAAFAAESELALREPREHFGLNEIP
ncbi:MAG TPA: hypothetical protein VES73_13790, partial [Lamprocystis sp. (in: g-proteobacteria)]|nr:hypothetical protein [Lamprocystis sp. (in: g-proteobacteria)]